jgi:hypothetical protein
MSANSVLNFNKSVASSSRDEEHLKALGLQDSDLDRFAAYFELAFESRCQSITVLVALLQRLCGVEKLRQEEQSCIWLEDIVAGLTRRLYMSCSLGSDAASSFGKEASALAEQIFSEALPASKEV